MTEQTPSEVICRPKYLTCRWLQEISQAIQNICPNDKFMNTRQIQQCKQNREADKIWTNYIDELTKCHSNCYSKTQIRQILHFERDYNDFR